MAYPYDMPVQNFGSAYPAAGAGLSPQQLGVFGAIPMPQYVPNDPRRRMWLPNVPNVPVAAPPAPVPPPAPAPQGIEMTPFQKKLAKAAPIIGGATALGGAAASLYQITANDEVQRANRKRLAELERLQKAGQLGLTPVEQQQLQASLYTPMQRALAQGQAQAEKAQASLGDRGSAGDYAQIRQESAKNAAAAQRDVATQVQGAKEAKKQQQLGEIEARRQAKAQYKADDLSMLFGNLAKSAAAGGAIAGSPPGTMPGTLLGLGGYPVGGPNTVGLTPEEAQMLGKLKQEGRLDQILQRAQALQGGM